MAKHPHEPESERPLLDPYARGSARTAKSWQLTAVLLAAILAIAGAIGLGVASWMPPAASTSVVTVHSTPNVLVAVRDMARLETAEVHVEKVIDLTDTQSHMFGLVQATDAILLVAVGQATLGVDLSKLTEADISMDPTSKTATLHLPAPEVFQAGLDENATYVYTRTTSMLAKRNEQLETQARREAVAAIRKAADTLEMKARAKVQAEKQITSLVRQLGAERVKITWKP
jgi:hypothetical protein